MRTLIKFSLNNTDYFIIMNDKKFLTRTLIAAGIGTLCLIFVLYVIPGIFQAREENKLRQEADRQQLKAKKSEAYALLGTMNRAQQAFLLENEELATEISQLDAKITGRNYQFSIEPQGSREIAIMSATPIEDNLPGFSSAVWGDTENYAFKQVICESLDDKPRLEFEVIGDPQNPDLQCPEKSIEVN